MPASFEGHLNNDEDIFLSLARLHLLRNCRISVEDNFEQDYYDEMIDFVSGLIFSEIIHSHTDAPCHPSEERNTLY